MTKQAWTVRRTGRMSKYDLIALDMDGTVLDDNKEISRANAEAIHEALRAGMEVIFCTGRSLAEMNDILADYPDMHYLLGESGAFLYDLREKRILYSAAIDRKEIAKIREAAADRDLMPIAFSRGRYMINRHQFYSLGDYGMAPYKEMGPRVATPAEDVLRETLEGVYPAEKINLYHRSVEDRTESRRRLDLLKPDIEYVDSEICSLECSPRGVSKASGLRRMSELLKIPAERMIMVGDADNDLEGLRFAGLAVAMGNANENVRAECDAVVADNNHDGCAEAIRRFLLD